MIKYFVLACLQVWFMLFLTGCLIGLAKACWARLKEKDKLGFGLYAFAICVFALPIGFLVFTLAFCLKEACHDKMRVVRGTMWWHGRGC